MIFTLVYVVFHFGFRSRENLTNPKNPNLNLDSSDYSYNAVFLVLLTSRKHDLTACKLVKNGLTGGIYHS